MPGKDNNNFSASDIARYHRGEMSAAERHALEKAALDDPFLADAIEGYAYAKAPEQELAELRTALSKKTDKDRAGVFFMSRSKRNTALKIAAMFILLAGLGLLIVRSSLDEKTNNIATIPAEKQVTDSFSLVNRQSNPDSILTDPGIKDMTVSDQLPANTVQSTVTASSPKAAAAGTAARDVVAGTKQPVVNEVEQMVSADEIKVERSSNKVAKESKEEANMDAVAAAPEKRTAPPSVLANAKEIKGSVTNENGQPLPYASVTVNGTKNRALTDKEGNFNLKVTDTTAMLSANAAGYEVAFVPVTNAANNVIVLKESSVLSEVVVSGQTQGRKKAPSKLIVEYGDLEPEEGWILYNEYVESKLKPIATNTKSKQRREVSLTFDVNENGEPINITVENSQCTQCNEEAIRLLKEGPKWKKGKKGKISFRF